MIFSKMAVEADKETQNECEKKEECYFEWYENAEKETCNAAKRAAGLCQSHI